MCWHNAAASHTFELYCFACTQNAVFANPPAGRHCVLQREIGSLSCEPVCSSSSGSPDASLQQEEPSSSSGSNSTDGSNHNAGSSSSSDGSLVVSLFEVPYNAENVAAFIAREHEFRFLAVQPHDLASKAADGRFAVSWAGLHLLCVPQMRVC